MTVGGPANGEPPAVFAVPRRGSAVFGAWIVHLLVMSFAALAVWELAEGAAVLAPVGWLLLVAWFLAAEISDGGPRAFLLRDGERFSRFHFVEIAPGRDGAPVVRFGFRLLGRSWFPYEVGLARIERVEWRRGQGSDRSGRDLDDWCVKVRYECEDPDRPMNGSSPPEPRRGSHLVGPRGCAAEVAAFGLEFVEFLRGAGLNFVRGDDGDCFIRSRGPTDLARRPR